MCDVNEIIKIIDIALKGLTFIVSIFLLYKAYKEYFKTQDWKKAEFLAKEFKDFSADFDVIRAQYMLDWNNRQISLKEFEQDIIYANSDKKYSFIKFDDTLLFKSLSNHCTVDGFTNEELLIRDIFDNYLMKLGLFNQYIENKLVDVKDVRGYLKYSICIMGDMNNKQKEKELKLQIQQYIQTYENNDVASLFKKFGFNINQ
jgi:hypothetical protein